MTFQWSEYFDLAQALTGVSTVTVTQEAKLRSAISRAYYSAYHQARLYLMGKGVQFTKSSLAHQSVAQFLSMSADRTLKSLGNDLTRLRDYRNEADYELVMSRNPTKIAPLAMQLAQNIITTLTSMAPANPPGTGTPPSNSGGAP